MVILGILGSIVLGKLISGSTSVSSKASKTAVESLASAISIGSTNNYIAYKAQAGKPGPGFAIPTGNICTKNLLQQFTHNPIPANITFPMAQRGEDYNIPGILLSCSASYSGPDGNAVMVNFKVTCTQ